MASEQETSLEQSKSRKSEKHEQAILTEFEQFEDIYSSLLPELIPSLPLFHISINLDKKHQDQRNYLFNEEFAY